MERPFPAYKGDEPYIFVSYAHADDDIVYREIQWLHDQGLNVWYDEGIAPGEEWTEELAQAIKGASHFLYFVTPDSIESRNCRNEVNYALEHDQPVVCVHLKETQLSGGLRLSIGLTQAILKHELGERNYQEKLLTALKPEARDAPFESSLPAADQAMAVRVRRWRRRTVVGAATAVALLLAAGGWWLATMAGGPAIERLAVLPVVNLTNDPDQEYLVQGVHTALIDELALAGASVIARRSVMQYQNSDKPIRDIARELGIDALIEASLERTGDSLRIRVQLIDGRTEEPLWTQSFDGDLRNIVGLERQVTRAIVDQIELALTPEAEARLAGARPVNPEAYEAYLKGMFHRDKLSSADLETALQYFELALEKDPNYALAYVGIARVWGSRQQMGFVLPHEAGPRAKTAAQKAIELDSTLAEAHHTLASIKVWSDWDWEGGETAFRRAIQLKPNYPAARAIYSHLLMILGRPDEAMAQIERALELDPLNGLFQGFYGMDLLMARRYDEALAQFQNTLKTAPNNPMLRTGLRDALYALGRYDEALTEVKTRFAAAGERELAEALERGYAEGGYREAMRRAAETRAARSDTTFVPPLGLASLFAHAGETERVLEWLEKAYQERDPNLPYIGVIPLFDIVRDDPRFQDLLLRMNLPGRVDG